MHKGSLGQHLAVFLVGVGVFCFIGTIGGGSGQKCMEAVCVNKQASGSSYCSMHKPCSSNAASVEEALYGESSKSSKSISESFDSSSDTGNSSQKPGMATNSLSYTSTKKSASTKKRNSTQNIYDSYDDGYDDIYMDGDYDYDRYDRDSDYADGVDDAMDELGEDW